VSEKIVLVETEKTYYVGLLPLKKGASGTLNLTTITPYQKKAIIKLFIETNWEKKLLREIELKNLPAREHPEILLQGNCNGATLSLSVYLEGKFYTRSEVKLKEIKTTRIFALALLGIVLVLLLIFLFFFGFPPGLPVTGGITSIGEATQDIAGSSSEELAGGKKEIKSPDGKENSTLGAGEIAKKEEKKSPAPLAEETVNQKEEKTQAPMAGEIPAPQKDIIYFKPDDPNLTPETMQYLKERILPVLKNYQGNARVVISGHCALYGTERGRMELSLKRAENVKNYLLQLGWNPEEEPQILGLGGKKPVTRNPDNQHLNRRVEIEIMVEP